MAMDVTGIPSSNVETLHPYLNVAGGNNPASLEKPSFIPSPQPDSLEFNLKELEGISRFLNRRLRFSINQELKQVVVKIIDAETDKVIKVLPPEEIQKLQLRIREALGILFDQLI
ncbi:MAG: flagellar protein FlaG [Spirochaetales bacterium]